MILLQPKVTSELVHRPLRHQARHHVQKKRREQQRKHAIVCVNGECSAAELLSFQQKFPTKEQLDECLVVAVDGGIRHALALDLSVDWLIGDLDSVSNSALDSALTADTRVVRFPREKDATDLELALDELGSINIESVTMLGFTGGRLDHALANLLLLARKEWPFQIQFGCDSGWGSLVNGDHPLKETLQTDSVVSLLPLSVEVSGVTTTGLYYPLVNATIEFGSTVGVSNVVLSPATTEENRVVVEPKHELRITEVAVTVQAGQLLALIHPPL